MSGRCCRNLILVDRGHAVGSMRRFRRLLRKKPAYTMFVPNEEPGEEGWMRFHCTNLGDDNRCTIYPTRPEICRGYPKAEMFERGGSLLAGCGYRLVREPREPFDRILANEMADGPQSRRRMR